MRIELIAGVDEVGRGALIGDVVAGAVILAANHGIDGLSDSKQLSPGKREALAPIIRRCAVAFAIGRATAAEIDQLNILQASLLAMKRAVAALRPQPDFVYVDGGSCPSWRYPCQAVVKGDEKMAAIAAASILAKTTRDRELNELNGRFPGYGLSRHKGYPTRHHLQALRRLGPTEMHRRSFAPVAALLNS